MNMKQQKKLNIKNYETAVNAIVCEFLNKQYGEEGEHPLTVDNDNYYWAGDDVGGVLCIGDTAFYDFNDIPTDIKEDAPIGEIAKYYDYCSRCLDLGLEDKCNYHSWLHGAPRHSEETLSRLEGLRRQFNEQIENANSKY